MNKRKIIELNPIDSPIQQLLKKIDEQLNYTSTIPVEVGQQTKEVTNEKQTNRKRNLAYH